MNKIKSLVVLLSLVALNACNSVDGTLQILQSFSYVNNASDTMIGFCKTHPTDYYCKGIDTTNKSVTFVPGNYHARLDFPSHSQVNMTIDYKTASSNQATLSFKMPEGQTFPVASGDVYLSAAQIGQAYDMKGHVDSEYSDSAPQSGSESCSVPVTRTECRWEHNPNGHGGRRECRDVIEYRSGRKDVQYYYHETTTHFSLGLFAPNSSSNLAKFAGTTYDRDKIYTYEGPCVLY